MIQSIDVEMILKQQTGGKDAEDFPELLGQSFRASGIPPIRAIFELIGDLRHKLTMRRQHDTGGGTTDDA